MKRTGTLLIAIAFVVGSGFWGKDKGGKTTLPDTASITESADSMSQAALEKTKKAASKIKVESAELIADLGKSTEEIKQKIAEMDQVKTLAYVNQYKQAFLEKTDKIAAATTELKDIPWKEKLGDKSKALKNQITEYSTQLNGLKEQSAFYLEKLESYGVDLSAYGL